MACPICQNQTAQRWRPFCSRRCADIDLGRWMQGSYTLEGRDGEIEPEELEEAARLKGTPDRRH